MGNMWHVVQNVGDIPKDRDLRLAVIEQGVVHELVFPCRLAGSSFVDAKSKRPVDVIPTHWQEWTLD